MNAKKVIAKCVISTASVVAAVPTVAAEFEWVLASSLGWSASADPQDYDSSHYTYCDAKKLGSVFHEDAYSGKLRISDALRSVDESLIHSIDSSISEVGETVPCTFDEIGVSYDDADALAGFWGVSISDAKAEAARLSSIDGGRSFRASMSHIIEFPHSALIEPANSAPSEQASVRGEISSLFDQLKDENCVTEVFEEWRSYLTRCRMENGPDFLISSGEHYGDYAIGTAFFPSGPFILDRNQNLNYLWTENGFYYELIYDEDESLTLEYDRESLRTFEWRVEEVDGDLRPFAAILRTGSERTDSGSPKFPGEFLRILKFGPDHSCPIATVSFYGPESYVKAREIADAALGANPCARMNASRLEHWKWEHRQY
jgi:hypothetical protein